MSHDTAWESYWLRLLHLRRIGNRTAHSYHC